MTTKLINDNHRRKHQASVNAGWWRKAPIMQKHITILFFLLLSIVLFPGAADAQTRVEVCHADLYFLASRVRTKVVLVRDTLVFVDDSDPNASFTIDRSNVLKLNEQGRIFTVQTRRPVWYRGRESRQFDFEFAGGSSS